jgi:hypothetical protein
MGKEEKYLKRKGREGGEWRKKRYRKRSRKRVGLRREGEEE